jgi:hypothetical protein
MARHFTPAEDAWLRKGTAQGMTYAQIGQLLGRPRYTVKARCRKLGLSSNLKISRDPLYAKLRYAIGLDRVAAIAVMRGEA